MARYLALHSVKKDRINGVKVLSFTDLDFKDEIDTLFETHRTFMNDIVRRYFSAFSDDWDGDYFVLREDDAYHIANEIESLYSNPCVDQEEVELIGRIIAELERIQKDFDNPTIGYLISWCK